MAKGYRLIRIAKGLAPYSSHTKKFHILPYYKDYYITMCHRNMTIRRYGGSIITRDWIEPNKICKNCLKIARLYKFINW